MSLILQDELIANLGGQLGVPGLTVKTTKIVFSKEELESVCGVESLKCLCAMGIICKKGNDYQFFHKSAEEYCTGCYLAMHQDELSEYLSKIHTVRDAQNLSMVLKFASAKCIKAAEKIMEKLVSIFCSDEGCQQYYNKKAKSTTSWWIGGPAPKVSVLEFSESLKVQQFIELCLECNYEASAKSLFTDILGKLFEPPASERDSVDDCQRVVLYGVTAKVAITLGYFLKNSGQNITRIDLRPSAHVTDETEDHFSIPQLGPAQSTYESTMKSLLALDTQKLEEICDKFIASHPELNRVWRRRRTEWVGPWFEETDRRKKEEFHSWHRDNLTQLVAFMACIQHAPRMPSVSDTDLSPVIESLPNISLHKLNVNGGYFASIHCEAITRLASVLARCTSLRILYADGLNHWDMRQKSVLCRAISGMINLTELILSCNEFDSDCHRHLVASLEQLSRQGKALKWLDLCRTRLPLLKSLDLYRTRLDKDVLYSVLDACKAMGSVKEVR